FDLDHGGAEVGEDRAGARRRHPVVDLDHGDVVEWPGHGAPFVPATLPAPHGPQARHAGDGGMGTAGPRRRQAGAQLGPGTPVPDRRRRIARAGRESPALWAVTAAPTTISTSPMLNTLARGSGSGQAKASPSHHRRASS